VQVDEQLSAELGERERLLARGVAVGAAVRVERDQERGEGGARRHERDRGGDVRRHAVDPLLTEELAFLPCLEPQEPTPTQSKLVL
jgi:hypothetical protein